MKYPISDHFDGRVFFNPGLNIDKSILDLIKWNLNRPDTKWPEWVENQFTPELQTPDQVNQVKVTFVNHVTFLWQFHNLNVLTDPVWSERVSPVSFAGPKRVRAPGLSFDQLPKIDLVLISHNHYDHLDIETVKKLNEKFKPIFIVPLANKKYLEDFVEESRIVELDWWQSYSYQQNVKIDLVPSLHWSARGMFDRREALWGGFVFQYHGKKLYFVGDSGYDEKLFKKIGETYQGFDLSFIPIGAYEPRWFMKNSHMNPTEAVQVHLDVLSKKSVPMHYGTFRLTDELHHEPLQHLNEELEKRQLSSQNLFELQKEGQSILFSL